MGESNSSGTAKYDIKMKFTQKKPFGKGLYGNEDTLHMLLRKKVMK